MTKTKAVAKEVVALLKNRGMSVEDGCAALVFALATACRASGGSTEQILDWVARQLALFEKNAS